MSIRPQLGLEYAHVLGGLRGRRPGGPLCQRAGLAGHGTAL